MICRVDGGSRHYGTAVPQSRGVSVPLLGHLGATALALGSELMSPSRDDVAADAQPAKKFRMVLYRTKPSRELRSLPAAVVCTAAGSMTAFRHVVEEEGRNRGQRASSSASL